MTLSATPGKIPETKKIVFNFLSVAYVATKPTDQSCWNSISRVPGKYLQPIFVIFHLPLKLRVVYIRNKQTKWQTWSFTNMINYFCCDVIKTAEETIKNVLLSVIWNTLLIEINLSQIRTLDIKREKVCAVCPYLSFKFKQLELKVEILTQI